MFNGGTTGLSGTSGTSKHSPEELGVEHSRKSTPSESLEEASVSLKRTLGTFMGDSKERSQYGLGDTAVLTCRGIGEMIFGNSPGTSTGLETLEYPVGEVLESTAWHTVIGWFCGVPNLCC